MKRIRSELNLKKKLLFASYLSFYLSFLYFSNFFIIRFSIEKNAFSDPRTETWWSGNPRDGGKQKRVHRAARRVAIQPRRRAAN